MPAPRSREPHRGIGRERADCALATTDKDRGNPNGLLLPLHGGISHFIENIGMRRSADGRLPDAVGANAVKEIGSEALTLIRIER